MPKLIVFDWDGTLCDSLSHIVDSMQEAFASMQLAVPSREDCRNVIGLGLTECMITLYPNLSEGTLNGLLEHYKKGFIQTAEQAPPPLFEGALEVLTTLKKRGFLLAVATGKSRRGLDRVLGQLHMQDFFHASRCADETASKPHPKMLHELMRALGTTPSQTWMVGDTDFDIHMGQNANTQTIAVNYGAHNAARLKAAKPDVTLGSIKALLAVDFS